MPHIPISKIPIIYNSLYTPIPISISFKFKSFTKPKPRDTNLLIYLEAEVSELDLLSTESKSSFLAPGQQSVRPTPPNHNLVDVGISEFRIGTPFCHEK